VEKLKKESGKINDVSCDDRNNIDDAALKTISHYRDYLEKVVINADADMSYLASGGNALMKEIGCVTLSIL
jgi:hypothetical protein